jgi:hypothetical protein
VKVGSIEGTPTEIRDAFQQHGIQLSDYIEKPETPLQRRWIVIPAVVGALDLLLLVLIPNASKSVQLLFIVVGIGAVVWITVSVQLRFKSTVATWAVAIGGLVLILVAAGIMAPADTMDAVRKMQAK